MTTLSSPSEGSLLPLAAWPGPARPGPALLRTGLLRFSDGTLSRPTFPLFPAPLIDSAYFLLASAPDPGRACPARRSGHRPPRAKRPGAARGGRPYGQTAPHRPAPRRTLLAVPYAPLLIPSPATAAAARPPRAGPSNTHSIMIASYSGLLSRVRWSELSHYGRGKKRSYGQLPKLKFV